MLDYDGGWVFLGADGSLYRLSYDPQDWHLSDGEAYPEANGWEVSLVHLEPWDRVFPPWSL